MTTELIPEKKITYRLLFYEYSTKKEYLGEDIWDGANHAAAISQMYTFRKQMSKTHRVQLFRSSEEILKV